MVAVYGSHDNESKKKGSRYMGCMRMKLNRTVHLQAKLLCARWNSGLHPRVIRSDKRWFGRARGWNTHFLCCHMPSLRPRLKILVSPLCAEANIFQSGLLTDTHWKEIEAVALWLQGDGARSPKKFWLGLQWVLLCDSTATAS